MKKLLFFFALAFASCNIVQDALTFDVSMPSVTISTPSVPQGTYTVSKEIKLDTVTASILTATDVTLSSATVTILTPEDLSFSAFSYGKLVVSSGGVAVTVFDNALSISGRGYTHAFNQSIKNVVEAAKVGDRKITYSLTVTATTAIPQAGWRIGGALILQ